MRSRLNVHPMKSSRSPIDQFLYYLLMHSIVSINAGFSPITNVSSTYMKTIPVSSSFNLYKRQGPVFHFFNPAFGVIFLMYYLNQKRGTCTRPYIFFISVNNFSYIYSYSITSAIPSGIFM